MNLSQNLVPIWVTYLSPNLATNMSPQMVTNSVSHQIWWQICHYIWWQIQWVTKFGDKFFTKLGEKFGDHQIWWQICHQICHQIPWGSYMDNIWSYDDTDTLPRSCPHRKYMVFKSEMGIFWWISITNNVKSCKKFDEKAQTGKFTVFTMWNQLRGAENMDY